MILILWNLIKLVFEIGQRFAAMLVYALLSPLAAACGVIGDGSIPKKAFTLFISSGVLWLLDGWCLAIAGRLGDLVTEEHFAMIALVLNNLREQRQNSLQGGRFAQAGNANDRKRVAAAHRSGCAVTSHSGISGL